jgi:hypothetical protein
MTPRRALRVILALLLLAALGAVGTVLVRRPLNDRRWVPEQAVLPTTRFEGNLVHVDAVRDFEYTSRDRYVPRYASRTYDLEKLEAVWFVLTPFSRNWRGPAHSFVTFGFADSQYVAISVEARKEPGEQYGLVTGLTRRFELMYVVGEERDLIGQRAAFGDYPVYLYPVKAPREKIRAMFVAMLERANALRERPEFYNTVTNNCTSNVVRHVNAIAPDRVPSGIKTILPGYTDEVAHRLGLIDTSLDIEEARARFRINEVAKRWMGDPAFSQRIRDSTG